MVKFITGLKLQFLLLSVIIGASDCVCPPGLQQWCVCQEQAKGFYVDCQNVGSDLSSILKPLEKVRVAKLRVTGAEWNVVQRFPKMSIRSLQLINCGIHEVEEYAFEPISNLLEELVIANNSLKVVPSLGSLPKMLSLNLKYNEISDVAEGVFMKTKSLKHLRLGGNKICSLSRSSLREIKDVVELLDLSKNCLTRVPAESICDLTSLLYLDLSKNRILKIADFELTNLPALKEIRLNGNQLSEITAMGFKNVPTLQQMFLQDNFLIEFDMTSMIEGFRQLEVLNISNNQLVEAPLLRELPNIRQVFLDSNRISHLNRYTFSGNPRLQVISLQSNQIATLSPNGFNRLFALTHLLLGNNLIRDIERDAFNGMINLEQLSLTNNSICELRNDTFLGIRMLKVLDLSRNGIHIVSSAAFTSLERLYWLDLSNNMIAKLPQGTFVLPIPNIILFGNPIHCDEEIVWLVEYLVRNRVRTHLPFHSDVMCAVPDTYSTVKLKNYIQRRTNDTFTAVSKAIRVATGRSSGSDVLGGLIPAGMQKFIPTINRAESSPYSNVPVVGAIAKTLPGIRHIPGLNYIPQATGARVEQVHSLNSALEKFTSPLIRVATGESDSLADVDQMIKALPELAANMVDLDNLDLSTMPPELLLHVLHGGQVAGVKKETLEKILRQHITKMYRAAVAARNGHPVTDESRYLPPLKNLPKKLVDEALKGKTLPYLNDDQMAVIREYYMNKVIAAVNRDETDEMLPKGMVTPQMKAMVKMLPPGYDIGRISPDILRAVAEGKMPDFDLLPNDLQEYILNSSNKDMAVSGKMTVEDLIRSVPVTEGPEILSSTSYDINKVSVDLIHAEQEAKRKARLKLYSTVMTCVVAAVSSGVIAFLFVYMRRKKAVLLTKKIECSGLSSNISRQQQVILPPTSRSSLTADSPR